MIYLLRIFSNFWKTITSFLYPKVFVSLQLFYLLIIMITFCNCNRCIRGGSACEALNILITFFSLPRDLLKSGVNLPTAQFFIYREIIVVGFCQDGCCSYILSFAGLEQMIYWYEPDSLKILMRMGYRNIIGYLGRRTVYVSNAPSTAKLSSCRALGRSWSLPCGTVGCFSISVKMCRLFLLRCHTILVYGLNQH